MCTNTVILIHNVYMILHDIIIIIFSEYYLFDRFRLGTKGKVFFSAICQVKEDPAEFYATTGNHNEWDVDRMQEGNVPRLSLPVCLTTVLLVNFSRGYTSYSQVKHSHLIRVEKLRLKRGPVSN